MAGTLIQETISDFIITGGVKLYKATFAYYFQKSLLTFDKISKSAQGGSSMLYSMGQEEHQFDQP